MVAPSARQHSKRKNYHANFTATIIQTPKIPPHRMAPPGCDIMVNDCKYNRENYPEIIGLQYSIPPSYGVTEEIIL